MALLRENGYELSNDATIALQVPKVNPYAKYEKCISADNGC